MSERTTISIDTPSGHKVELHSYMTGGEWEQVQSIINSGIKLVGQIATLQDQQEVEMTAETAHLAELKAVELLVVRFDEEPEGAFAKCQDLPLADWRFLREAVNKITKPDFLGTQTT